MGTEKKNLDIYRGDSKNITVTFSNKLTVVDNGSLWLTIKTNKDDIDCGSPNNSCIFQTSDTIVQILDNNNDIIGYKGELFIPPAQSKSFIPGSYFFDIQVVGNTIDGQGNPLFVKTLVDGKFKVNKDITIKTS